MTSVARYIFGLLSLAFTASEAIAWEFGPLASYAAADKSLSVNGRLVNLKSGGVGLSLAEDFISGHVQVDAAALYGYSGSASATFSGAAVSGPAKLTTTRVGATIYWKPQSRATPFVRVADVRRSGDTVFTGSRNGALVAGAADLKFNQSELSIGLRLNASDTLSFFAESGRNDWRLTSDASGTVGALNARTQIESAHSDPFVRFGANVKWKEWRGLLTFGEFRMTADNQTKTRSVDIALMYAF